MAGKIFINYRRGDDPGAAQALFARLEQAFPADQLFMDVDNIEPGLDFTRVLNEQVAQCDILISVIGKGWIDALDDAGHRRLDNPADFVRVEIESALAQDKRVIPVLVGQAQMPRADQLPDTMKSLAVRNAVRLTHERFRADTQALINALQRALNSAEEARTAKAAAERQRAEDAARAEIAAEAAEQQRRIEAERERQAEAERERQAALAKAREDEEQRKRGADEERRRKEEVEAKRRAEEEARAKVAAEEERRREAEAERAIEAKPVSTAEPAPAQAKHSKPQPAPPVSRRKLMIGGGLVGVGAAAGIAALVIRSDKLVRTFVGHSGRVESVAIAPDGRTAVSGSDDTTLRLWDLATGDTIRTLSGHSGGVGTVAIAPDGRTALSGSADRTLRLWDLATGSSIRTFTGHSDNIFSVAITPDGRTALSSDGKTLRVWDLATGNTVRTLATDAFFSITISSIAIAPDGHTAVLANFDEVLFWNLTTGTMLRSLKDSYMFGVMDVAVAPDGRTGLYSQAHSTHSDLTLFDLETATDIKTFTGHTDLIGCLAFAPDGSRALSGSSDKTLRLWDVASGETLRIFRNTAGVPCLAIAPDGRTALSGSDSTLKLWDLT